MVGGLMYLVDSNVWLSVLLAEDRTGESKKFLQSVPAEQLAITEFSLYSIGIILTRLKQSQVFVDFITDTLEDSAVQRIRLELDDLKRLPRIQKQFDLDFDDAYQYVAARKHDLILVSYDHDFDRMKTGRKTPGELLGES